MYKLQLVIKLDAIFNINHYHYIYELITLSIDNLFQKCKIAIQGKSRFQRRILAFKNIEH